MSHFHSEKDSYEADARWGIPAFLERIRLRLGASHRQFMVFGLLVLTGGVMMARPAGMLLWHRLRIISGMPRTAIADQDPEIVAARTSPMFETVSEGRSIRLDVSLVRDPFESPIFQSVQIATATTGESEDPSVSSPIVSHEQSRLVGALSSIRLTGTAKGLGTALINGSVRSVGSRFEVSEYTFQLTTVDAGSIQLEVVENPLFKGWRCIVGREGATLLHSE